MGMINHMIYVAHMHKISHDRSHDMGMIGHMIHVAHKTSHDRSHDIT